MSRARRRTSRSERGRAERDSRCSWQRLSRYSVRQKITRPSYEPPSVGSSEMINARGLAFRIHRNACSTLIVKGKEKRKSPVILVTFAFVGLQTRLFGPP